MDHHTAAIPSEHDACPRWCRRAHVAHDHPEDRHHQGRAVLVAAVTGHPTLEPDEDARAVSVAARLVRRTDSELTWIEILAEESHEVRLVVTVESARRLVAAAQSLLTAATA